VSRLPTTCCGEVRESISKKGGLARCRASTKKILFLSTEFPIAADPCGGGGEVCKQGKGKNEKRGGNVGNLRSRPPYWGGLLLWENCNSRGLKGNQSIKWGGGSAQEGRPEGERVADILSESGPNCCLQAMGKKAECRQNGQRQIGGGGKTEEKEATHTTSASSPCPDHSKWNSRP